MDFWSYREMELTPLDRQLLKAEELDRQRRKAKRSTGPESREVGEAVGSRFSQDDLVGCCTFCGFAGEDVIIGVCGGCA